MHGKCIANRPNNGINSYFTANYIIDTMGVTKFSFRSNRQRHHSLMALKGIMIVINWC